MTNTQKAKLELEIKKNQAGLELIPKLKEIIKQFDGKVFGKRVVGAVKATGADIALERAGQISITYSAPDIRAVSADGEEISIDPVLRIWDAGNNADPDTKRLNADGLITVLSGYESAFRREICDLNHAIISGAAEWEKQMAEYVKYFSVLYGSIPPAVRRHVPDLAWRLANSLIDEIEAEPAAE
jgi:hypothetical protein